MAIDRAMDKDAAASGDAWAGDADDTLNWHSGMMLGRLTSVAGTNTITAQLAEDNGYSALSDNATCVLIPANATTGAATLAIEGGAAKAIRRRDGSALSSTHPLVAGVAYPMQYSAGEDYWRVLTPLASEILATLTSGLPPIISSNWQEYTGAGISLTSTSTWTTLLSATISAATANWIFGDIILWVQNVEASDRDVSLGLFVDSETSPRDEVTTITVLASTYLKGFAVKLRFHPSDANSHTIHLKALPSSVVGTDVAVKAFTSCDFQVRLP